ncbi:MAG: glycosyl transferase family 1 [Acidobacteria bacterium]|nr:MAG: glycosyl transferase family 1 [Acidobacteriota bacterium]
MKVLVAHNAYQQAGGEDAVFGSEAQLLRRSGHQVREYLEDNHRITQLSNTRRGIETLWSRSSYKKLSAVLAEFRPDVVHFHNIFPLISPSAYYAAKNHGAAVVQTLHNFRLLCANAIFFRQGKVCEDCLTSSTPFPGVLHRCYRNSRAASAGVVAMVTLHRALGTWRNMVDFYIALSEFARSKFVAGGLPEDKIIVKPNCLADDPGLGRGHGRFALYIGRLSPEKGITTLVSAWQRIGGRLPIKIVGDGPEAARVKDAARNFAGVEFLGPEPRARVLSLLQEACVLVIPSTCYENFPVVAAEAFATGTPVLASDIGSLLSIVEPGLTGIRFRAGDAADLAEKVMWLVDHSAELDAMRPRARAEFERRYSAGVNLGLLLQTYDRALGSAKGTQRRSSSDLAVWSSN